LVPKYFSNIAQIDRANKILGAKLITFLRRDINFPISKITEDFKRSTTDKLENSPQSIVNSVNRFLKKH
jgi:hypothetical protein